MILNGFKLFSIYFGILLHLRLNITLLILPTIWRNMGDPPIYAIIFGNLP
jgi:hypothetical protein